MQMSICKSHLINKNIFKKSQISRVPFNPIFSIMFAILIAALSISVRTGWCRKKDGKSENLEFWFVLMSGNCCDFFFNDGSNRSIMLVLLGRIDSLDDGRL